MCRRQTTTRTAESGPKFFFPEADFEDLLSMIRIRNPRFRSTMKRVAAAIAAAGARDISERLADELQVTRKQAGALLRALVAIGIGGRR
jgi:hypothetical protein